MRTPAILRELRHRQLTLRGIGPLPAPPLPGGTGTKRRLRPATGARPAMRLRLASQGRATARVPALERVMLRLAAPSVRKYFRTSVALRLALGGDTLRHTQRLEICLQRTATPAIRTLAQHLRTDVIRHMLRERVDPVGQPATRSPTPRPPLVVRVEQRQAAPRLTLTLVRTAAAASARPESGDEPVPTSPRPARAERTTARPATVAAPLVLPAQELSRVTDHVIRQLDHRVLSWQERTART